MTTFTPRRCCHTNPSGQHTKECTAIERAHTPAASVTIRDLEKLTRNLRRMALVAEAAIPAFVAHTNGEMADHDGYQRKGVGTSRPSAVGDGEGIAIDYSDRTGDTASGMRSIAQHRWDRVASLLAEATLMVGRAEQQMRKHTSVETARDATTHRCTGGMGQEGQWTRPECVNLAVTGDGLCDPCRQRRDHWRRKEVA